jgi:vacuolar-type H+-ATPase subunit B/Vma2
LAKSAAPTRVSASGASIIGAEDLSETDQNYLTFADTFERHFVGTREDEERSIVETLDLAPGICFRMTEIAVLPRNWEKPKPRYGAC